MSSIKKSTNPNEKKNAARRAVRANAAFAKMTKAEKRVQIARDVILQLNSKHLIAKAGIWLDNSTFDLFFDMDKNKEVCDVVKNAQCHGCAIGGLFLAAVEKADKLKVTELPLSFNQPELTWGSAKKYLKRFFSDDQINLIEFVFEKGFGFAKSQDIRSPINAEDFYKNKKLSDNRRMKMIMENIIENGGTFKPNTK